ncbi:MAG: type IV pilus assembly protein PilM [Candidatus Omnitrophica bacterium]|nr:type IV pilus assembly protein PilM [Candidatus Omnitrophota bacterium]MDD5737370.1 type IV pilus assembly protein PilM [Candidatus Omnitrophota bacterium]
MGKRALGIDIGAGSVKLVELEKTSEGVQLLRAKFFDLTQHPDQEKREALVREGVEGLLKTEKIKSGNAAISLSGQSVFIRFLKLPKIQKGKVDKIIKYEAQQQVPFPLDKITWDHQIFHSGAGPEEDVLFVAAKKELVEATLLNFSRTGLNVESVDVSPLSLLNAITYNEPLAKGVIIDIGAKATNLIVLDAKGFWVRSVLIAGDEMTHAIASKMNIPFDKAEDLKRKEGMVVPSDSLVPSNISSTGQELVSILNTVVSDMVSSIIQSLEFYKSKHGRDVVFGEVILSGGGSKLKGIEDYLAKGLGMQIRRANLGQKIKCPSNLRVDIDFQSRFGAAIGLGLRLLQRCPTNIDLLPAERKEDRDFKKERIWIIAAGVMLSLIPFTIAMNIWFQSGAFRKQILFLDDILAQYDDVKAKMATLKDDIKKGEQRIKPLENVAVRRPLLLEALLEVEKLLPKETWLTSLSEEKDWVSIEGRTSENLLTITEFKNKLSASPLFESVEIIYASLPKDSEEGMGQLRDFSIKFKLKVGK